MHVTHTHKHKKESVRRTKRGRGEETWKANDQAVCFRSLTGRGMTEEFLSVCCPTLYCVYYFHLWCGMPCGLFLFLIYP